jgi:hypothetical protein
LGGEESLDCGQVLSDLLENGFWVAVVVVVEVGGDGIGHLEERDDYFFELDKFELFVVVCNVS